MSVEGLLSGADGVMDRLRLREKELEESLGLVRERLSVGEEVLAAVSRWRSLSVPPLSPSPEAAPVPSVPVVDVPAVVRPGADESLVGRIVLLLGQDPSRVWKASQVRELLGAPAGSVHAALSRSVERGRLVRVSAGRYRAADAVRVG